MTVGDPSPEGRPAGPPALGPVPGDGPGVPAPEGTAVLEAVYRLEYPRLVALARLLLDHRADAEEVVQEAFVRVLAGWDRLERRDDPLPYVRRSVVNLARDRLRRRRTVRRAPAAAAPVVAGADGGAERDEDRRELAAALRGLPDRQRECVVLRYLLDLSTAETATALGITDGSVKTHLSRGLAALGTALEGTR